MPTDEKNARRKGQVGIAILAAILLLIGMGGVAFYMLGRPDPSNPASQQMEWGDRVERRLDAIIDARRPKWADPLEEKLDKAGKKIGWD
jgi:hypothetical protein